MVKKSIKRKLVLQAEVVRSLADDRLAAAQGGLFAIGSLVCRINSFGGCLATADGCGCTDCDSGCGIKTR